MRLHRSAAAGRGAVHVVLTLALMLAVLVVPGLTVGESRAATPRVDLPMQRYTLPNGLEVVLSRDPRLPTVSTNLWYHVGAADELPTADGRSRTGFAHLFEHMMFQGSGHLPEGRLEQLIEGAGGYLNASTNLDYTNYFFADLPSDRLELALWAESDRMGFLLDRLDEASLANQKSVVRSERRENWEQSPYALGYGELFRQLFPVGHPYRGAVIGSHEDIEAANLADVREFFRTYYVPNNATLVVAGNFEPAKARRWIAKYFGPIPAGPEPPEPVITVPAITAEKRVVVTDEVELPAVTMAWLTPPALGPGDAEADVTAHLLGGGESSRLYDVLVRKKKIAQDVYAYQDSAAHPSVFLIDATAKPGHTAEELEDAIDAELAHLAADGPGGAEAAASRTGLIADLVRAVENVGGYGGRADMFNYYNHYTGNPDHLNADIARYAGVTGAEVKAFVAGQLATDKRVVLHTVPGKKVLPPDPAAPAKSPAATKPTPSKQPWRNKVPVRGETAEVALPPVRRFELGNGMPVYLVESHGLPVVTASVVSRYGSSMDPAGSAGLANFAATMLRQGTKNRGADATAREVAAFGGLLDAGAERDGSALTVSVLAPQAERALELASALVRRPAFRKADVARVRDDLKVVFQQDADDPGWVAWRLLVAAIYGRDHPYGHLSDGSRAGVSKVTRADLVRFHADAYTPANTALVLAGDLTQRQARKLAESAFGSWRGRGPAPTVPGAGAGAAERVVVVDTPGAAQTTLEIGQAGLPRSHPDFDKLRLANYILGGAGISSRLNVLLREEKGWTYGAASDLAAGSGPQPFDAYGAFSTAHTGAAVRRILAEIERLRSAELSPGELRRAKTAIVGAVPSLFQTTAYAAYAVREMFLFDLPPGYYAGLRAQLAPITAAAVRAAAAKHLSPDGMKIVAVGDRKKILPQLKKLDLGKIAHRKPNGAPAKQPPVARGPGPKV